MATTHVTVDIDDGVVRVTLIAEPAGKPPTLDFEVLDQLEGAIRETERQLPHARTMIVESAEPEYFVVGANLRALQEIDEQSIRPWVRRGHEVFAHLQELSIPVVAIVRGYAGGGGLELALACDFIYATDTARFALPEAGLGLVTGWGGSYRLSERIGAARAKEMVFTGRAIDAKAASDMGLINFFGSEEEVQQRLSQFVADVTANSAVSLAMEKSLMNAARKMPIEQMKFEEAVASTAAMSSSDTAERLNRFFANRRGNKRE